MTGKRTGSTHKGITRKMKLKKETLKDLDARNAKGVKGGTLLATGVACRRDTVSRGLINCAGQKTV